MTRSQSGADLNLLFGILAVQMDFVTRDQLLTAMGAWVLDKSKSLGAILVDQKALTAERHMLLQALVQEHLKQHHNDPHESLAAFSSVGSVKKELENIGDADVQASLIHMPAAGRAAEAASPGDFETFTTYAAPASSPGSQGLRFRILRPHARGGLGEVLNPGSDGIGNLPRRATP